jgi:predicted DCC family thiol-disulfide oxidoreductase YuxK
MISLSSEITDNKGRRAGRGWIFFDAQCPFCLGLARRFGPVLEPRGFGLAALQDPRVLPLLDLPPGQLLLEMRVLTAEGRQLGGADALIYLAGQVWWTGPLALLARLPRMRRLLRAAYRWVAARRNCVAGTCAAPRVSKPPAPQFERNAERAANFSSGTSSQGGAGR